MDLFLRSRGRPQDDEYRWHALTPLGEREIDEPAPPLVEGSGLDELTGGMTPCCALGRFDGRLVLLLSDVVSQRRADFMGRPVWDSALWVAAPGDEDALRGLAAAVLRDPAWLQRSFDAAITFDAELRFRVRSEVFDDLLTRDATHATQPDARPKVEPLSLASRASLADELEAHLLPAHDGLLVLAGGSLSRVTMARAGVWRGLASDD